MENHLPIGVLIAIVLAALIGIPFSADHVRSQTSRAPTHIKVPPTGPMRPADPAPVPMDALKPAIAVPVQPMPPVSIPRPAESTPTVVVPARPRLPERESPDCTVHRYTCAGSCDPLPNGWSSYGACLRSQCKQVEENCIEKLAQGFRLRRTVRELTFLVESKYAYKMQIEFYSQDRKVAWPGNGQAFNIDDYRTHVYKLSCNSGETICYGAWPTGSGSKYWGKGFNDRHSCENCCARCDGQTVSFVLR